MLHYDREKLGDFLKESREAAGITQAEVARRVGHQTPQFISNLERGLAVAPIELLAKLVKMYKANPKTVERIILTSQEAILVQTLKKFGKVQAAVRK